MPVRILLLFVAAIVAQSPCLQDCPTYAVPSQPTTLPVAGTRWCWNDSPNTFRCQDSSGVIFNYGGLGLFLPQTGVAVLTSDINPSPVGQEITLTVMLSIR